MRTESFIEKYQGVTVDQRLSEGVSMLSCCSEKKKDKHMKPVLLSSVLVCPQLITTSSSDTSLREEHILTRTEEKLTSGWENG